MGRGPQQYCSPQQSATVPNIPQRARNKSQQSCNSPQHPKPAPLLRSVTTLIPLIPSGIVVQCHNKHPVGGGRRIRVSCRPALLCMRLMVCSVTTFIPSEVVVMVAFFLPFFGETSHATCSLMRDLWTSSDHHVGRILESRINLPAGRPRMDRPLRIAHVVHLIW
jgi:hypothetical protein